MEQYFECPFNRCEVVYSHKHLRIPFDPKGLSCCVYQKRCAVCRFSFCPEFDNKQQEWMGTRVCSTCWSNNK